MTEVQNNSDIGSGSLRQIIASAPTGAVITFNSSLAGQTITLNTQISINKELTITGLPLENAIIINGSGGSSHRIFNINFNIVSWSGSRKVRFNNLILEEGTGDINSGGGIRCVGVNNPRICSLEIDSLVMRHNKSELPPFGGGAIYAESVTLNIKNSFFHDNSAHIGGAIYVSNCILNMANTSMKNNYCLTSHANSLDLYDLDLSRGSVGILVNVTIIDRNINTFSSVYVHNLSALTIINTTISRNYLGVENEGGGIIDICNSIIAGNINKNIEGFFTSKGNNIFGDDGPLNNSLNDIYNVSDPGLRPMGDYGGNIETMALKNTSVAIGHGAQKCYDDIITLLPIFFKEDDLLKYDARGIYPFFRIYNGIIDAGAVQKVTINPDPPKLLKKWRCKNMY